ncbi:MAG TPA: zinc-binding alcohol dehydrogenase family protein [Blastocatellia bacterium]|nr:zinc-binding alcohol dehydrogenase family protein [Blastocatellia bacterium]
MITTEAWVLNKGELIQNGSGHHGNRRAMAELNREMFSYPDLDDYEVLVEPIYGGWEGNMGHALERDPVDICRQRNEDKVVLCNSGVARVLQPGPKVSLVAEGDLCMVTGGYCWDQHGYIRQAYAYDAPNTIGMLAKRTKIHEKQLIPIPSQTKYSLKQWAAFSLRYVTAWANWKQAYGCLRIQLSESEYPHPHVWGWGGGVVLAELDLARRFGCEVAMLASRDSRLEMISRMGIEAIDRRQFGDLNFDPDRYESDAEYRNAYRQSESRFLQLVREKTRGELVSIFIDNIGTPVVRATLKALARPGVIATCGWKRGMSVNLLRAIECISWHTHVHTHYARYQELAESVRFAEETGWMAPEEIELYDWEQVPDLARDYCRELINDYFPLIQINKP